MKIYVAAPWVRKMEARNVAYAFADAGYDITSRWLWLHGDSEDDHVKATEAQNDVDDVDAADVLVLVNLEKSEGKAVETGMALATHKPIVLIGERSNIFHYLPRVVVVSTISQALNALKEIRCQVLTK